MRRPDEMDERRVARQQIGECRGVERIACDRRRAARKFILRFRTDEPDDVVSARDEQFDQRASDVPGSTGDKDVHPIE